MLTNRLGLPEPLVWAIANTTYSRGDSDISVTQLIQPPYLRKLQSEVEVTTDVADMAYALLGTSVHSILERAFEHQDVDAVVEKRLFAACNGWVVSGQMDLLMNGVLSDYKVTSVYARDGKTEWEQQLNLLSYLCYLNNLTVEKLQIVAIYRDWSRAKINEQGYPNSPMGVIPVKKWSIDQASEYMVERVKAHQHHEPPPCTDEERWMTKPIYALKSKNRKNAIKLYENSDDAAEAAKAAGKDHFVEYRPAEAKRCMNYCDVAHACPVFNTKW